MNVAVVPILAQQRKIMKFKLLVSRAITLISVVAVEL